MVAGYAEARPEIELRVLKAKNARAVVDVIADRTEFSSLQEYRECLKKIHDEWDTRHARELANTSCPPVRPRFETLPHDDWATVIPNRFLGRQLQLNDVAEAVQGMLYRARTGRKPDGGRAVKVIWVHGFGGMGKSWFLHRSRLQAGTDVRSLIIDWDSPVWRYPLMGEPRSATDLFEVIACRLVQTCGEAAADAYWSAQQAVRAHGELHRRLRDDFDSQLALAAGPDRVSSPMLRLLENEGLWVDDQPRRAANIEAWRRNHDRYESSFVSWCRETARDADPAAIEPNRFLAEGLRASLRRAALEKPLLLLLDTGEVLSQELDGWLRRLLVPLCHDESPLLVLIGSRLLPDVALPGGSRQGWQAELPRERLRTIPFDELVRFSVEEIESALARSRRPSKAIRRSSPNSCTESLAAFRWRCERSSMISRTAGAVIPSSSNSPKRTTTSPWTKVKRFARWLPGSRSGCSTTSIRIASGNERTTCATSSSWPCCNAHTSRFSSIYGPAGASVIGSGISAHATPSCRAATCTRPYAITCVDTGALSHSGPTSSTTYSATSRRRSTRFRRFGRSKAARKQLPEKSSG